MDANWVCEFCSFTEYNDYEDGYYYCKRCSSRAEGFRDTGLGDEADIYTGMYSQSAHRASVKKEPEPQAHDSQFWRELKPQTNDKLVKQEYEYDETKPYVPADFGSESSVDPTAKLVTPEDYAYWLRFRYVMGIQLMIEFQCEVLVEEFGVSPLIVGLVGGLWIRYVASTRVFEETWASQIVEDSEMQTDVDAKVRVPRDQDKDEPHDTYGKRLLIIWLRALRNTIPLSLSLSVCFLACHIAREPVLPTDMVKWTLEGKLPYLNAYVKIDKMFGEASENCPLSAELMFRPFQVVSSKVLETQAGYIAQCIGLELPPVNFNALARRYLKQLQLPLEKILPHASLIYDWSMPPHLWLSSDMVKLKIPSRVCVMSIILVAIRILYNINGFGKWEEKYCNTDISSSSPRKRKGRAKTETKMISVRGSTYFQNHKSADTAELLGSLEMTYEKIREAQENSVKLSSYLKVCKDVIFGAPLDNKEEIMIETYWKSYENQADFLQPGKSSTKYNSVFNKGCTSNYASGEPISTQDDVSVGSVKDRSLNRLKLNMKENGFSYVPPRVQVRNVDYLHCMTKNNEGTRVFVAHADYYILLRVCALVAEVDVQCMHKAVLKFEKRLEWFEKNIDRSLKLKAPQPSSMPNLGSLSLDDEALDLSKDMPNVVEEAPQYTDMDESLDFSNYRSGL
ncbi:hypothetical protein MKW94_011913 [Papaver nudicaule]|uniref:TATA box-binding protein-associated factor RNA polymerase I subunit B n=1 Tax=Papaver nudicaule TaxID=74823 RepID=A0AA41W303_PAPNU|nr:hypothetical protein [Papaver nudicaule]